MVGSLMVFWDTWKNSNCRQTVWWAYFKKKSYCQIRVWQSLERNQLIFVWYHADGEEPTYEPAIIPNVDGDLTSQEAWVYHGRNEYEVNKFA